MIYKKQKQPNWFNLLDLSRATKVAYSVVWKLVAKQKIVAPDIVVGKSRFYSSTAFALAKSQIKNIRKNLK